MQGVYVYCMHACMYVYMFVNELAVQRAMRVMHACMHVCMFVSKRAARRCEFCRGLVKNLSTRGPTRPRNTFGELISLRLCIRYQGVLHRGMVSFKFFLVHSTTLITVGIGSFGDSPWQVARAAWGVSKLALSCNLGMARPLWPDLVCVDKVAINITQVLDGVHIHVCTCTWAEQMCPNCLIFVSRKQLDGLGWNLMCC